MWLVAQFLITYLFLEFYHCVNILFFLDIPNNEIGAIVTKSLLVNIANNENNFDDENISFKKQTAPNTDNSKTLNDLLDSIRTIARSIELVPIDGISNGDNNNNKHNGEVIVKKEFDKSLVSSLPCDELKYEEKKYDQFNNLINFAASKLNFNDKEELNKCSNSQPIINNKNSMAINNRDRSNWFGSIRSTSLIRAANFICDKIVSSDVPRQLAAKHSSLTSFFGDEIGNNENAEKKISNQINEEIVRSNETFNIESFSRGRSTEKRSNTNSDSSLPPEERNRDKSQPRFYHHEDDYSKKLRRASRQRREAAALAAKSTQITTTDNNNILKIDAVNKSRKLPPPSPFTQRKVLQSPNVKTLEIINSSTEHLDDKSLKSSKIHHNKVIESSLRRVNSNGMRRTNSVNG